MAVPASGSDSDQQRGQYHWLTRQVNIIVEVEGRTFQVKVDSKIVIQKLVHKVAQGLGMGVFRVSPGSCDHHDVPPIPEAVVSPLSRLLEQQQMPDAIQFLSLRTLDLLISLQDPHQHLA